MAKRLTDGKISIGAYMLPDMKKPCLCVQEGNKIVVYGHFNTVEGADKFIDILGKMVGATFDWSEEDA